MKRAVSKTALTTCWEMRGNIAESLALVHCLPTFVEVRQYTYIFKNQSTILNCIYIHIVSLMFHKTHTPISKKKKQQIGICNGQAS